MTTNESEELLLLKKAIQNGDLLETKRLLLLKTSLSRNEICEAFLETIKANQIKIFQYFIEDVDGLSLRYTDLKGRRALHYAVEVGGKEMVNVLLKHGATLSYADNEGYQAIHIATQTGNIDMLTFLITNGANVSGAKTLKDGYTPIHIAALSNQPEALEILAERVGSLNIQTKRQSDSLTPLHLAVKAGHGQIVKILCERRACLDLADIEGRTPLHYAADRGNIEIMKILLAYGSSLNVKDSSRRTVLQYSIYSKSAECVQALIDSGARIDEADMSGHTPIVAAVAVGSADIVQILVKHGADVNVRAPGNETPLLLASSAGNVDVIKILLDAGADVLATNRQSETVLHKCQKVSHEKRDEVVQLLVKAGGELSRMDSRGFTPLHNCAFQTVFNNYSMSTLRLLVESGCLLTSSTRSGVEPRHSPLCWFVWRGYFEAARYLINSGWNLYPESWMYLPGKSPEQDSFHQWMRDLCRDVPSLMHLCRDTVRHHLIQCSVGREILTSLSKLDVPRTLRDYLMLRD